MQKKIKILHVLHAVGGVDVYLRLISKTIDPTKFELVIVHGFTDTDKIYSDLNADSIKEYKIPIDRNIHPIKDLKSVIQLIRLIKKEKPNLIHAHSAKGGIIGRAVALFFSIPVFYTPHAFSYLSAESNLKKRIFLSIEKLFKFSFVKVLATSQSEADRAIQEVGYKAENVIVFKNCILPISDKQRNKTLPIKLPSEFIASVGRPSYQKNIETMVEVFRQVNERFPETHLILMGVGYYAPNVNKVNALLEKYNLKEKFIMLPWISQEEIFTIIDQSELYLSTSRYEGLPYSIIESLALGKACVVSDCDGNRDLVTNGENGFVIKQEDIQKDMAQSVLKILNDLNLRKEFETDSLNKFNENYNILVKIKELENIYLGK